MVALDVFRRQDPSIGAPTGTGIQNSAVTLDDTPGPTLSALVFDTTAGSGGNAQTSAPPLVFGASSNLVMTTTPSATSQPDETSTVAPASASGKSISIGTVVGSCVGAFVGAALLILVGLFFYKRYSQNLKQRAHRRALPRSPYRDTSGAEEDRRRSNTWNRLDDDGFEDKWEGMKKPQPSPINVSQATPQNHLLPPLEKMDMFNKSPSEVSHRSQRSEEPAIEMNNHPYGQSAQPPKMPEPRDLLGRDMLGEIQSGPPMSWASESSKSSFLSATRLEGGAMSPTLAMAIPTPPATRSQPHHWESAEVINLPEGQSADITDVRASRTSLHNPFFGGGGDYVLSKRSRSQSQSSARSTRSTRSRANSNATITQRPPELPKSPDTATTVTSFEKKDRVVSIDPFKDPLPPPTFIRHQPTGSASSAADNERAIRQLMAATGMDLDPEEVQRRLKAVSMQPSVISSSGDSMYTDAEPDFLEEEAIRNFPHPPSSSGHTAR